MRTPLPHRRWARGSLVAGVVAGAGALVWWRGPSWALVGDAFTAVYWEWVVGAVALNLASVVARSLAWGTVIDQAMPPPHPRLRSIFSAFSVGLLANVVLPGRIGELARVAVLVRRLPRRRGAWATLAGTVFAHRVFDVVAFVGVVAYVLTIARLPQWAITGLLVIASSGVTLLAVGIVSARRHYHMPLEELGRLRSVVTMARQGLGVMRAPLAAAGAVLLQCAAWGFQLLAVYAAMRAFRIQEGLAAAAVVLVLMNLATIVTLWPGNVGLLQAAVALPLVAYGIDYRHGFAFGIGLQAIEASVGIGVGLAFLAREGLSFAMLREMPEAADADRAALRELSLEADAERSRARVPG